MRLAGTLAITLLLTSSSSPAAAEGADGPALAPAPVSGPLARGDAAYFAGRDAEARDAYREVLALDSLSVRANHRLGLLLARADRLDSALTLLARARRVEPDDDGLLLDEARLLSWAGRLGEAIADYDHLLALAPGQRAARLGRARVLGWSGRYAAADSAYATLLAGNANDAEVLAARAQNAAWRGWPRLAEAGYLAALRSDSSNTDALLGLARLRHDAGRQRSAADAVTQALSLDPTSRDALTLRRQIRAAQRPQVEFGVDFSQDSDRNIGWSRRLSAAFALAEGVRGFLAGGSLDASDPVREASRTLGEWGVDASHGPAELTLATGAHWLAPASGKARTVPTWRGSLALRAGERLSLGAGYARSALDETALLIGGSPRLDEAQASLDAALPRRIALSTAGGSARLDDGNRRASGLVAFMHPLGRAGSCGVLARRFAYEHRGAGYFSPDRFTLAEARTVLARSRRAWTGRLNAGLGAQQVGAHAATQVAWRAAGEMEYRWATIDRIVASVSAANSAASSTTGAYRFFGASLALRVGS